MVRQSAANPLQRDLYQWDGPTKTPRDIFVTWSEGHVTLIVMFSPWNRKVTQNTPCAFFQVSSTSG
jgi:hypothetical protein